MENASTPNGMDTYQVDIRADRDMPAHKRVIDAHRVEGWANDYAFFQDDRDLAKPTLLIPRRKVDEVEMLDQQTGQPIGTARREFAGL